MTSAITHKCVESIEHTNMCNRYLHSDIAECVMGTDSLVSGGDKEWSNAPGPVPVRTVAVSRLAMPLLPVQSHQNET